MPNEDLNPITIVLVEDNVDFAHTVRDFLAAEPGFDLVGIAHRETDFFPLIARHLPDIALMDLGLSRPDSGVELMKALAKEFPVVLPVVMTVNEKEVLRCYEIGARGYILKSRLESLAGILRRVYEGQLIIPPDVGEILVRQMAEQGRLLRQSQTMGLLSEREKEILVLQKNGLAREAIADRLCLSPFTVRRHFQNALEKTGLHSVKELMAKYGEVLGDQLGRQAANTGDTDKAPLDS